MTRLVLLDNEAVQALADPHHPKHQRVIGYVQIMNQRKRKAEDFVAAVPTSVRVEAGTDRSTPAGVSLNRLQVHDLVLDVSQANVAARIRGRTGVSVADAHLGACIQTARGLQIAVLTSDPDDMRVVAGDVPVTVVSL